MYKKLFISMFILLFAIFSFSICFAADDGLKDAANGVKNVVGGAENAVEGAVKDVSNASKNATASMENAGNTMTKNNNAKDGAVNTQAKTTNANGNYNAVRVAADGTTTFMGMTSTAWTWLILGIAAVAIIALVWYYSAQMTDSHNDK